MRSLRAIGIAAADLLTFAYVPVFAVGMVTFISVQAVATTITFETEAGYIDVSPFVDSGYQFVYGFVISPPGGSYRISTGGASICITACSTDGTNALFSFNAGMLTMSAVDGSPFSLLSLDAAQTFVGYQRVLDLNVIGQVQGGGIVTDLLTTPAGGADAFQTFTLPNSFTDLLSVKFVGADTTYPDGEFAIDNIVVQPFKAVPESSTLALFGAGLVGLCALRRRKATGRISA